MNITLGKLKIILFASLFFYVFLFFANVYAATLQPIENISIKSAILNYSQGNSANVSFVLRNTFKYSTDNFSAQLILTQNGKEMHRKYLQIADKKIDAKSSKEFLSTIILDNIPKGEYDAYLAIKIPELGISSNFPLGKINIKNGSDAFSLNCKASYIKDSKKARISCNSDLEQETELSVHIVAKPFASAVTSFENKYIIKTNEDGSFTIIPDFQFDESGPVELSIFASANSGALIGNTENLTFEVPGVYTNIAHLAFNFDTKKIKVYLRGTLKAENRQLLVGIKDKSKICFYKIEDLSSLAPVQREYSVDDKNTCSRSSSPFAVVYENTNSDLLAKDIIAFSGVASKADAAFLTNEVLKLEGVRDVKSQITPVVFKVVIFVLALLVLLILFAFMKKKNLFVIALVFIASAAVFSTAHAEIFDSVDAPKIRFEVNFTNLNNEVPQNQDIIFTISAFDNMSASLRKYPNTAIYAKINSGPETLVMPASDNRATVIANLPHSLPKGVHTLTFRAPNACGSAFDYSVFDNSKFGTEDCVFSVQFKVIDASDDLRLQFYADPVAVEKGSRSKLYWISQNANSCSASGKWTGAKALSNKSGYPTPILNDDINVFSLTCSNSTASINKRATVYTYTCGDGICSPFEECAADCGSVKSLNIEAIPQLVREGDSANIRWTSQGYDSCSVTEDNPDIDDRWNTLAGSKLSSALTKETKYTLTCSSSSGTDSKSVKVKIVPKFREF